MAKPWANGLYASAAWGRIRRYVIARERGRCQACGRPAKICDHIIELTEGNIHDYRIALNPDNVQLLCQACHNTKTHKTPAMPAGIRIADDGSIVIVRADRGSDRG
jgi:5-methylcytosine-specific restriction endonuclease McrA